MTSRFELDYSDGNIPSEHEEQRFFIMQLRKQWPGVRVIAIPNGGARGIREAARLKAEGVSPGVPDLFIPEWLCWVEMKKIKGGRVSPDQSSWHGYLIGIGHRVQVCAGWKEAMEFVTSVAHSANQTA